VAAVAFALHFAALTLAPISIGQAVLAEGLVFLAVLAERFFGFELGRRQWIGIALVAVSLALLTLTGGGGGGDAHSAFSLGENDRLALLSPWTVIVATAAVFCSTRRLAAFRSATAWP
jgi:drug/metabolite transporter (DMT)-like permease